MHCQATEEDESQANEDGDAGRSFWDAFRAEQPKKHFMPEQSKLIGKEVYLLVLQQVHSASLPRRTSMHLALHRQFCKSVLLVCGQSHTSSACSQGHCLPGNPLLPAMLHAPTKQPSTP